MWRELSLKLGVIFDHLLNFLFYLVFVLMVFCWLSICVAVFMRYLLHSPLVWAIEASEYALVTIVFLGAAWLLKKEGHVSLDIVITKLKPRTRAMVNASTSFLGAIICLVVVWYSTEATWDHFQKGVRLIKTLGLPSAPFLSVVPVGFLLLFIQFLRRSYGYMARWKAEPKEEERQFQRL